jgi:hypothetical protein
MRVAKIVARAGKGKSGRGRRHITNLVKYTFKNDATDIQQKRNKKEASEYKIHNWGMRVRDDRPS